MSSPSRTFSAPGARRMMAFRFVSVGPPIFVTTRRNVPRRKAATGHLITHIFARSVVTGSYGMIVLPVMDKPQPGRHRPALWQDGKRRGRARFASIRPKIPITRLRSGCRCRKMINHPCLSFHQ